MSDLIDNMPPIHPGEHIKLHLEAMNLTNAKAAKIMGISAAYLGDIVNGKRGLSAPMCVKLAALFGASPDFWASLQKDYEMKIIAQDKDLAASAAHIRAMAAEITAAT